LQLIFVNQNWPGGGNLEAREAYEKWRRGYALRELRKSLTIVPEGRTPSDDVDTEVEQDQDEPLPVEGISSNSERNSAATSASSTREASPCDVCVVSSVRVGERIWESLAAGLAGEGGVVSESPRGVLRGTVVSTLHEPVRVCLELICVGRERERM